MFTVILRACESIDFGGSRPESNQGLRALENRKTRIDSHSLRCAPKARLEGCGPSASAVALRGSSLRAEHLRVTDFISIQRLHFDDRSAVIAADPQRAGIFAVVDIDAANI